MTADAVPQKPDPGSDAARSMGCLCDPVANAVRTNEQWVVAGGCPVHAPRAA